MIDKLASLIARHPWPFIVVPVLVALAIGSQIPRVQVDPELKNQLPPDFPARVDMDRIEEMFGGTELVMVSLVADDVLAQRTLERLKRLSDGMGKLKQFDRVLSLFELKDIKNVGDAMVVDPAVKTIPRTNKQREALRRDLRANDLVYGSVVSEDFKAAAIIGLLTVGVNDEETVRVVQQLVDANPGPEPLHVAGMPLVRKTVSTSMSTDMRRFLPLGIVIMLVFLFVFFHQLRGMLLPVLVVVLSVLVSMGLLPIFGWKLQMVTILLPVIILAIANNYGIHLFQRYQEFNTPGNALTKQDLARTVLSELTMPVIIAGLTTMAGLMCLLLHVIVPAQQIAVLATIGVGYAVITSLCFICGLLAVLPKAKPLVTAASNGEGKKPLLERLLGVLATAIARHPKKIVVGFVGIVVLVGVGIWKVQIDTNTINYFPKEHPLVKASHIADRYFGGSTTFSVAIAGDIKQPGVLRRLSDLERKLKALPYVDQVTSIARVVREMNKVMNGDDRRFDAIPAARSGVAELLLMYENSGDPEDFDRLIDFGYKNALLTARINTQSTKQQTEVIRFVRRYVKEANAGLRPLPAVKAPPVRPRSRRDAPASRPAAAQGQEADEDSPFTMVAEDEKPAATTRPAASRPVAGQGKDEDSPFTMKAEDDKPAATTRPAASQPTKETPSGKSSTGRFTTLGGFAVLFNDLVDAIVYGQVSSLVLSLVLVVIIVALMFRSVFAGVLAGGTLALAMAFLFGMMGLAGIDLNLPTALLSSIMIGVGVDYTTHFLWRCREERRAGSDPTDAVVRTLTTTGRGIIINALSVVIGFSVMFVSTFVPVRFFGFLVVVSISACLLGAMVLMPALVLLLKPRFLQPSKEV